MSVAERLSPAPSAERESALLARAHPLTMFGLDALISGAARLRPGRLAVRDARGGEPMDHAELDRRVGEFRARLQDFDLRPGERVLLAATPSAATLVALIGIVAAGLEPVLAPLGPSAATLAAGARAAKAAALIAPSAFAGESLEALALDIAAQAPSIRLIASLGPGPIDGAVDFGPGAPAPAGLAATRAPQGKKVSIGALDAFGVPRFHEQGALLAHGLALVAKARVSAAAPLVALVSPGTIGGLVAGPLAALLSGAPLHFLAPFEGDALLAHLDAIGPARLVAPHATLADFDAAGLMSDGALLAYIAVERPGEDPCRFELRPSTSCPVVAVAADGAPRLGPRRSAA